MMRALPGRTVTSLCLALNQTKFQTQMQLHLRAALIPTLIFAAAVFGASAHVQAQTIRTIAGTGQGTDGGAGGAALATNLVQPFDVELGPDGSLYICEFGAH